MILFSNKTLIGTRCSPLLLIAFLYSLMLAPPTQAQKPASPIHRRVRHHRATVKRSMKVWVNTKSGVYHYPGQRWYGATSEGEYMTEADARKRGFRPTHNGQ